MTPRRILSLAVALLMVGGLVALFAYRGILTDLTSTAITRRMDTGESVIARRYIDSAFNYAANGLNYRVTYLEFGAEGCSACRRMEKVLEEISARYPDVNVVFVKVLKPELQHLMYFYGVATIPTQVLLDGSGNEIFRSTGYNPAATFTDKLNR